LAGVAPRIEQGTIFSRGRVLLVKDSPYFTNIPEKSTKDLKKDQNKQKGRAQTEEPHQEELTALLSGGMSDTILVFFVQNVDKRKKINKYLDNAGAMVEFPPLKGTALARWIRDELDRESKEIEDSALNILVQRSGENLALLKRELEKLVTCLGEEKTIDYSLVKKLVPENAQGNIFNLVDELGRKNAAGALNHLHMMRQQNEPPLRILAMVIRHFRLLYRASLLLQEGLPIRKNPRHLTSAPFCSGETPRAVAQFPW
jgi:DNA polymerase III subunit delta